MIIENEIWKDIPGYEGYYQVSNYGNFRSLNRIIKYKNNGLRIYPGKILLTEPTKDNYRRIARGCRIFKSRKSKTICKRTKSKNNENNI